MDGMASKVVYILLPPSQCTQPQREVEVGGEEEEGEKKSGEMLASPWPLPRVGVGWTGRMRKSMPTLVAEAGLMLFKVDELFLGKYIYKLEHKI